MPENEVKDIHRKLDVLIEKINHLVSKEDCHNMRDKCKESIIKLEAKINKPLWMLAGIGMAGTLLGYIAKAKGLF